MLNQLQIKKALKTPKTYPCGDSVYLQVNSKGGASWLFRSKKSSRTWIGLGPHPEISAAEAAEKGRACQKLLAQGIDPYEHFVAAKQAAMAQTLTFAVAAERYIAEQVWRSTKTPAQWRARFAQYANPVIGDTVAGEVRREHVLQVLAPIWRTVPITASRLRAWMHRVFEATRGEPGGLAEDSRNPADWAALKGRLAQPRKLRPIVPHAALPYAQVPALMTRMIADADPRAVLVRVVLLTGVRSKPIRLATWAQIDLDKAVWSVPGMREKSGEPFRVPLSTQLVDLFRSWRPSDAHPDDLVFPGVKGKRSPCCTATMLRYLNALGLPDDATVHGLRSTMRDWIGEETVHPADIAEAALSHKFGQTRAAYQRGDLFAKRRVMMQNWADYCHSASALAQAA